jgi:hypothetical protein
MSRFSVTTATHEQPCTPLSLRRRATPIPCYWIGRCPLMNPRQVLAGLRLVNELIGAGASSVVSSLKQASEACEAFHHEAVRDLPGTRV